MQSETATKDSLYPLKIHGDDDGGDFDGTAARVDITRSVAEGSRGVLSDKRSYGGRYVCEIIAMGNVIDVQMSDGSCGIPVSDNTRDGLSFDGSGSRKMHFAIFFFFFHSCARLNYAEISLHVRARASIVINVIIIIFIAQQRSKRAASCGTYK